MEAATVEGATQPIGSILGLSVTPVDTVKDIRVGFNLKTLGLLDNPLRLLYHSNETVDINYIHVNWRK